MRDAESFAAEPVEKFAIQRFAGRESDRMHQTVQAIPVLPQVDEQLLDIVIAADIALEDQFAAKLLCHFLNTPKHPLALVGKSQFGAFTIHGLRDAIGNRAVADHAGDQNSLVGQKSHVVPLQMVGNDVWSLYPLSAHSGFIKSCTISSR